MEDFMSTNMRRVRIRSIGPLAAAVVVLALFAASVAPQRAAATSYGYCNTLVASSFTPCPQGSMYNYNFNRNLANLAISAVCATIGNTVVVDPTAGLYGSGCATNAARYSFCHAPMVNNRHAWVSQFSSSGANRTLAGLAVTNLTDCAYAPYSVPNELSSELRSGDSSSRAVDALRPEFRALKAKSAPLPPALLGLASLEIRDTTEARAVGVDGDVYLLPGPDVTCMGRAFDDEGPGAIVTCADTAGYTDRPRLAFSAAGPGRTTVWGAVPDGVTAVSVATAAGRIAAPVENNGFALTVAKPTSVAVETRDGVETLAIPASTTPIG